MLIFSQDLITLLFVALSQIVDLLCVKVIQILDIVVI